jgi:hypothetical protein
MAARGNYLLNSGKYLRPFAAKTPRSMSGGRTFNMKAANLTAAFDKRKDGVLVRIATMLRHAPTVRRPWPA